jgi:hypothetical protein
LQIKKRTFILGLFWIFNMFIGLVMTKFGWNVPHFVKKVWDTEFEIKKVWNLFFLGFDLNLNCFMGRRLKCKFQDWEKISILLLNFLFFLFIYIIDVKVLATLNNFFYVTSNILLGRPLFNLFEDTQHLITSKEASIERSKQVERAAYRSRFYCRRVLVDFYSHHTIQALELSHKCFF